MEKVSFYSEGHKLVGYLSVPSTAGKKVPGIVCCHGYSGMIELFLKGVAERLTEAGYATLIFYHRGLGESEGPRSRIIPWEQAQDAQNAITYLQTRTEVDPDKIGLYGTSLGGCTVAWAGAIDNRAKCIVSTGGIGNCERWLKSLRRYYEWTQFLKDIEEDRINRVLTNASRYVHPFDIVIHDPGGDNLIRPHIDSFGQKWGSKGYPLEVADAMLISKPEQLVDQISPRAILFIHLDNDVLVPPQESWSMYAKAKEPKRIVIIEGKEYQHHDVYSFRKTILFDKVMTAAIDWYKEYLPTE